MKRLIAGIFLTMFLFMTLPVKAQRSVKCYDEIVWSIVWAGGVPFYSETKIRVCK